MCCWHLLPLQLDPDCVAGLTAIVQDTLVNNVTPEIMVRFNAAALAAGKNHDFDGLRTLLRVAATLHMRAVAHGVHTLFPSIQLGFDVRGAGVIRVIEVIRVNRVTRVIRVIRIHI